MPKQYEFIKAEQRSEEWLKLRKEGLGASDIPAVLGISPYKTPYQLWAEKRGDVQPPKLGAAANRGVLLEDSVAKWYEQEKNVKVRVSNGVVRMRKYPWAMASLDRTIVGTDGLLEIKTSSSPRWSLYPVPPEVVAQVQWQMMITGAPWVDVAALLGGLTFRVERVEASNQYQLEMFRKAQDFMERVKSGRAPAVAGSDSDYFAQLHPQQSEEWELADSAADRLAIEYREASEEERLASEKMQDISMALKEMIGGKVGIMGRGWQATWKQNKPSLKTDWLEVADYVRVWDPATYEELLKKHTEEKAGSRVFRFKVQNEGE
jgi:putative phage-type endonuclease